MIWSRWPTGSRGFWTPIKRRGHAPALVLPRLRAVALGSGFFEYLGQGEGEGSKSGGVVFAGSGFWVFGPR